MPKVTLSHPELPWTFWAGFSAVVLFLSVLQIPRVSRVWLSWLPTLLQNHIRYYFNPPPAVHPDVSDPNKLPNAEDVPIEQRIPLMITRIFLSAEHGIKDVEHYLKRFTIAFLIFCAVMLVVVAITAAIQALTSRS